MIRELFWRYWLGKLGRTGVNFGGFPISLVGNLPEGSELKIVLHRPVLRHIGNNQPRIPANGHDDHKQNES